MGRNKKRKDGTYRFTRTINGVRIEATGVTEKIAKEKLDKKVEEFKRTGGKQASDYTFADYYERKWLPERDKVVKPSTIRKQSFQYDKIETVVIDKVFKDKNRPPKRMRFVDIKLVDLSKEDIRKLQTALQKITVVRKGKTDPTPLYKASSINDTVSFVKHVLYGAVDDEYIAVNPAARIKSLRITDTPATETIHRALTIEESDKFFAEAGTSWYYCLYVFMISSGLRIGEAAALRWSDIKPRKGIVHVNGTYTKNEVGAYYVGSTKTEAGNRDIVYTDIMKEAVQGQKELNSLLFGDKVVSMDDFIFLSPRGLMLRESSVNRDMERICNKIGIDRITSHGLRDSFSTRALESGMAMKTLQKVLGHADFATTSNVYAHVTDQTKEKESKAVYTGITTEDFTTHFALRGNAI